MKDREPHCRETPPEDPTAIERNPVHVVLDNLRSAFNVGSIFRTSDAGAIEHLHLCGMTAHPPHDRLARTALGATEYVPWTHHLNSIEAIDALERKGIPMVAIEIAEDAVAHVDFDWPRPVAIVLGHETRGIGPEVLGHCAARVRIPMHGFKNTINVATAYGVILYEILRQWKALDGSALSSGEIRQGGFDLP